MIPRRHVLAALSALAFFPGSSASARYDPLVLVAPGNAVGAVGASVGGSMVSIRIDRSLPSTHVRLPDGTTIDIAARVMLKGSDAKGRARYLDDARNATRVAANIRDALSEHTPERASLFRANHRRWARPFARQALRWTQRLSRSGVAGKLIADPYHRVYLLEWAGARVANNRGIVGPSALARVPPEPRSPTPEAYSRYIEALVASLVQAESSKTAD
ncbi:MAG: hypothetical protein V3V08_02770 [Nannocystaceae bacterium]